jgi:hypothetical protein
MRTLLWVLVGSLALNLSHADGPALQPYVATYAVTYRGLDAGTLRMELSRDPQSNRYTFETRANPSVLARLMIGRDAIERTVFEPSNEGIRPIEWYLEDGKNGKDGDGHLTFDWTANKVVGEFEGKPVELPIQPGLQDRLSIQVAVSAALVQGREPASIVMVNGDKTREYSYARGASQQMDTKLGKLDTVIYESTRPGSNRVSKVWHAPSLEYLPVRAEQIRKGKVETVMVLVALERK